MRYLLALFLAVISSYACGAEGVIKLHGQITSPLQDSIYVTYNNNPIAYYPNRFGARIDKKGHFSMTITVPSGVFTQAQLKHGNKLADLILEEGDDLDMTVDAKHFDSTVHYTGKGSEIENFLAKHSIERGTLNTYPYKIKPYVAQDSVAFLKGAEDEKVAELTFLEKNIKGLPSSFINYWIAYYNYYTYFCVLQYPQTHQITRLRRYTDTIPQGNYYAIKNVPYAFSDSLIQIIPYLLYVNSVVGEKLKATGFTYVNADTAARRKFQDSAAHLCAKLMPDRTAEYYFAQDLYTHARYQPLDRTEHEFSTFKHKWPESSYLPLLQKHVAIAESQAPGQPAPDLDLTTANGKPMKLSDLRSKVVYLQFWADWCKECVGDMISEKRVKDVIKDKPLAFVYVSIGSDTTKENRLIKHFKLNGYFSHAGGGWDGAAAQAYSIESLPSYFLIDEDGKFAVQSAPSPRQYTELILDIEKLFK